MCVQEHALRSREEKGDAHGREQPGVGVPDAPKPDFGSERPQAQAGVDTSPHLARQGGGSGPLPRPPYPGPKPGFANCGPHSGTPAAAGGQSPASPTLEVSLILQKELGTPSRRWVRAQEGFVADTVCDVLPPLFARQVSGRPRVVRNAARAGWRKGAQGERPPEGLSLREELKARRAPADPSARGGGGSQRSRGLRGAVRTEGAHCPGSRRCPGARAQRSRRGAVYTRVGLGSAGAGDACGCVCWEVCVTLPRLLEAVRTSSSLWHRQRGHTSTLRWTSVLSLPPPKFFPRGKWGPEGDGAQGALRERTELGTCGWGDVWWDLKPAAFIWASPKPRASLPALQHLVQIRSQILLPARLSVGGGGSPQVPPDPQEPPLFFALFQLPQDRIPFRCQRKYPRGEGTGLKHVFV